MHKYNTYHPLVKLNENYFLKLNMIFLSSIFILSFSPVYVFVIQSTSTLYLIVHLKSFHIWCDRHFLNSIKHLPKDKYKTYEILPRQIPFERMHFIFFLFSQFFFKFSLSTKGFLFSLFSLQCQHKKSLFTYPIFTLF